MAKILVSMKDTFLKSIDEIAAIEQRSRSELIREALRSYIAKANRAVSKKAKDQASLLEDLLN